MEALSPALYAILASEGRSDLTNPQKSIAASVLLAAEVWDLLNAGILWGVSSRRFHAGRQPLPAELDHLSQTHRAILVDGASCPSEVYRMLSAPGPCLEREDDYRRIKGPWPIEKPVDYGDMAPAIRQKVRQVALGKTPSPADDALLVALFRASWLRGFYIRSTMDQVTLSKRLKALRRKPPMAGGWPLPDLIMAFLLLREFSRI